MAWQQWVLVAYFALGYVLLVSSRGNKNRTTAAVVTANLSALVLSGAMIGLVVSL